VSFTLHPYAYLEEQTNHTRGSGTTVMSARSPVEKTYNPPAVQPDSPRLVGAFIGRRCQGPASFLISYKEQRIVWMSGTIDRKISGVGTTKGEGYIGQLIGHLEVFEYGSGLLPLVSSTERHTSLPLWTEVASRPAWIFLGIRARECVRAAETDVCQ
jgi:hypothetical protein